MLISLTTVIISVYVYLSKYYVIHLNYVSFLLQNLKYTKLPFLEINQETEVFCKTTSNSEFIWENFVLFLFIFIFSSKIHAQHGA